MARYGSLDAVYDIWHCRSYTEWENVEPQSGFGCYAKASIG